MHCEYHGKKKDWEHLNVKRSPVGHEATPSRYKLRISRQPETSQHKEMKQDSHFCKTGGGNELFVESIKAYLENNLDDL